MADEYVCFLFDAPGTNPSITLRKPRVTPETTCLAIWADRTIFASEETNASQ